MAKHTWHDTGMNPQGTKDLPAEPTKKANDDFKRAIGNNVSGKHSKSEDKDQKKK